MELIVYGGLFLACAGLLYVAGEWIVLGLMRLPRVLGVREFVLAFFVMAAAASIPNLFVGVTSALQGIPELSLGDVFGNNLVAMTLAIGAGVFFARRGFIEARGQTIRTSLLFTAGAAVLPILLLADGYLGRIDGILLIGFFVAYTWWLLSRHERFSKRYTPPHSHTHASIFAHARLALWHLFKVVAGVALILIAAIGIVHSASFFAGHFGVPLVLVGILIVGLGGALPEVYFSAAAARRGDTALIMGNVMGSVIVPATLVLGIVVLIHPIQLASFEFLAGSRGFLLVAAALFFLFASTRERITRVEGTILVLLYLSFLAWVAVNSA